MIRRVTRATVCLTSQWLALSHRWTSARHPCSDSPMRRANLQGSTRHAEPLLDQSRAGQDDAALLAHDAVRPRPQIRDARPHRARRQDPLQSARRELYADRRRRDRRGVGSLELGTRRSEGDTTRAPGRASLLAKAVVDASAPSNVVVTRSTRCGGTRLSN